ncbi:MAG: hypothetical protein AAGD13_01145 [Pseudomonadota bacterium]
MAEPEVYTLLVQVGRSQDDGLPDGTTGAAILCFSAGRDEKNAVDETVSVLRQAGMSPLEVDVYGTRAEREADGEEISPEDAALMDRALAENAVIVTQIQTFDD